MAEAFLKARSIKEVNRIPGKLLDLYDLRTVSEYTDPYITKVGVTLGNNSYVTKVSLSNCSYYSRYAFASCPNLSIVNIQNCAIEMWAFARCDKLSSVYIRGDWCSVYGTITGINSTDMYLLTKTMPFLPSYYAPSYLFSRNGNIYVLPSLYSNYINDSGWSYLSSKIFPYEGGI